MILTRYKLISKHILILMSQQTLLFIEKLDLTKMGKKRIEKIAKIENDNTRKVTLCKRKKGLMKKMIELSILCDLKIFMLI